MEDGRGVRGREPTRISNLRKRLQRIELTKQRCRDGGPPPDRRQLEALSSEQEIRDEISQWENFGVVRPTNASSPESPTQPLQVPQMSVQPVQVQIPAALQLQPQQPQQAQAQPQQPQQFAMYPMEMQYVIDQNGTPCVMVPHPMLYYNPAQLMAVAQPGATGPQFSFATPMPAVIPTVQAALPTPQPLTISAPVPAPNPASPQPSLQPPLPTVSISPPGAVQVPPNSVATRVSAQPAPPLPPRPPGEMPVIPKPAADRDRLLSLAYPQTSRTLTKEPTRIVNLRRRLQRILCTRYKLENPGQPPPDNRQLAALAAEADIVWEIEQWEMHRIIYPLKPEMKFIPPDSTEGGDGDQFGEGNEDGDSDDDEDEGEEGGNPPNVLPPRQSLLPSLISVGSNAVPFFEVPSPNDSFTNPMASRSGSSSNPNAAVMATAIVAAGAGAAASSSLQPPRKTDEEMSESSRRSAASLQDEEKKAREREMLEKRRSSEPIPKSPRHQVWSDPSSAAAAAAGGEGAEDSPGWQWDGIRSRPPPIVIEKALEPTGSQILPTSASMDRVSDTHDPYAPLQTSIIQPPSFSTDNLLAETYVPCRTSAATMANVQQWAISVREARTEARRQMQQQQGSKFSLSSTPSGSSSNLHHSPPRQMDLRQALLAKYIELKLDRMENEGDQQQQQSSGAAGPSSSEFADIGERAKRMMRRGSVDFLPSPSPAPPRVASTEDLLRPESATSIDSPCASPFLDVSPPRTGVREAFQKAAGIGRVPDSPASRIRKRGGRLLDSRFYQRPLSPPPAHTESDYVVGQEDDGKGEKLRRSLSVDSEPTSGEDFNHWLDEHRRKLGRPISATNSMIENEASANEDDGKEPEGQDQPNDGADVNRKTSSLSAVETMDTTMPDEKGSATKPSNIDVGDEAGGSGRGVIDLVAAQPGSPKIEVQRGSIAAEHGHAPKPSSSRERHHHHHGPRTPSPLPTSNNNDSQASPPSGTNKANAEGMLSPVDDPQRTSSLGSRSDMTGNLTQITNVTAPSALSVEDGSYSNVADYGDGGGRQPLPALRRRSTHFLENIWTLWFSESRHIEGLGTKVSSYANILDTATVSNESSSNERKESEDGLIELGSFNTIEGFWMYWNNLRISYLKDNCNLYVFKKEIRPVISDRHNAEGGRWVADKVPKDKRSKLWGDIVMAMIGELIEDNTNDSVCGVVLSTMADGDCIELWTDGGYLFRTKSDQVYRVDEYRQGLPSTQEKLAELFHNDSDVMFAYEPHVSQPGTTSGATTENDQDAGMPTHSQWSSATAPAQPNQPLSYAAANVERFVKFSASSTQPPRSVAHQHQQQPYRAPNFGAASMGAAGGAGGGVGVQRTPNLSRTLPAAAAATLRFPNTAQPPQPPNLPKPWQPGEARLTVGGPPPPSFPGQQQQPRGKQPQGPKRQPHIPQILQQQQQNPTATLQATIGSPQQQQTMLQQANVITVSVPQPVVTATTTVGSSNTTTTSAPTMTYAIPPQFLAAAAAAQQQGMVTGFPGMPFPMMPFAMATPAGGGGTTPQATPTIQAQPRGPAGQSTTPQTATPQPQQQYIPVPVPVPVPVPMPSSGSNPSSSSSPTAQQQAAAAVAAASLGFPGNLPFTFTPQQAAQMFALQQQSQASSTNSATPQQLVPLVVSAPQPQPSQSQPLAQPPRKPKRQPQLPPNNFNLGGGVGVGGLNFPLTNPIGTSASPSLAVTVSAGPPSSVPHSLGGILPHQQPHPQQPPSLRPSSLDSTVNWPNSYGSGGMGGGGSLGGS